MVPKGGHALVKIPVFQRGDHNKNIPHSQAQFRCPLQGNLPYVHLALGNKLFHCGQVMVRPGFLHSKYSSNGYNLKGYIRQVYDINGAVI